MAVSPFAGMWFAWRFLSEPLNPSDVRSPAVGAPHQPKCSERSATITIARPTTPGGLCRLTQEQYG